MDRLPEGSWVYHLDDDDRGSVRGAIRVKGFGLVICEHRHRTDGAAKGCAQKALRRLRRVPK